MAITPWVPQAAVHHRVTWPASSRRASSLHSRCSSRTRSSWSRSGARWCAAGHPVPAMRSSKSDAHLCGDPIDLWPPGVLAFSPSGCPRKRLDLHVKTDSSAVSLHPHFHVCIRAGPTPSWKRVSQTATHQHPFLQHLGKLRGGGHRDPRGIAWVFGSQAPPRLVKET